MGRRVRGVDANRLAQQVAPGLDVSARLGGKRTMHELRGPPIASRRLVV